MDLSPLKPVVSPAACMIPHIASGSATSFTQYAAHSKPQKQPCPDVGCKDEHCSDPPKRTTGVECTTVNHNGSLDLKASSSPVRCSTICGGEGVHSPNINKMKFFDKSKDTDPKGKAEKNSGFEAELDVVDDDDDDDDEDEDPVECVECGEEFQNMQEYVDHSCIRTTSTSSLGNNRLLNDSRTSVGTAEKDTDLSDVESFVGKIVYNPDGSAIIIEGSDSDDGDLDALDVPRLEGAIVDKIGLEALTTVASIPQIASAVFVPKSPSSAWSNMYISSSNFFLHNRTSNGAPVMHSFKVCNVRNSRNPWKNESSESNRPHSIHVPTKPILMCFICKLSFGYAKSFINHATGEHGMNLLEEEKSIMSRPNSSAILQKVGKEKEPLMSFLEPLPIPHSSGSHCSQSLVPGTMFLSSAANAGNMFLSSASPVSKSHAASTEVSYVYTKPKMSEDVSRSPNSNTHDQLPDDSSSHVQPDLQSRREDSASFQDEEEDWVESDEEKASSEEQELTLHRAKKSAQASSSTADPENMNVFNQESMDSVSSGSQDMLPLASSPMASLASSHVARYFGTCDEHPQGRAQGVECPKCDMVLGSSQSLGGHMTMMHSRNSCKTLKCPKCNWHYKYQETLEIHMKEKHPDNDAQCIYCLTTQPHPRLARGETYSCGYKPYRCQVCNYSTTTKGNLSIHMQSDKHMNNMQELTNGSTEMKLPPAVSSSSVPAKTFSEDAQFKKLKQKQTWRCEVCNYETIVARNLRIHMTSEKHMHNMMVLQQNMKHMQRDMQLQMNQLVIMGQQDPTLYAMPNPLSPGMYQYDQTLLMPGMPPGVELPVSLARENGASPEEVVTDTSDASKLFQCCICNLHSTDSLESLHQHLQLDRTKQRESENIAVSNGTYLCNLCTYKTNLKANFQLHCKTDKHVQRLQMVNHIKEGGPSNEWRLSFLNASNPTQVRCSACNFYTSSVHKLQIHSGSIQHESNAHVFRLLQLAMARLQAFAGSSNLGRYYYRCVLCGCNARTKQTMVQHARTIKHLQQEQSQMTTDPRDIFVAMIQRDGENVVYEYNESDGEAERSTEGVAVSDRILEPAEKVDISGGVTALPATLPNSIINNNNNSHTVTNHNISSSATTTTSTSFLAKSSDAETFTTTVPRSSDVETYPRNSPSKSSNHISDWQKTSDADSPVTDTTSRVCKLETDCLLCPLCQDEWSDLSNLQKHLAEAHNVTQEGLQRLLSMVVLPSTSSATLSQPLSSSTFKTEAVCVNLSTQVASKEHQEVSVNLISAPQDTMMASSSFAASWSFDEAKDLDMETLEKEHSKVVSEDAVDCPVQEVKCDPLQDEQYRCQTCSKTFTIIDQLYAHQNELGHLELKQTPRGPGYLCWRKGCNQYFKTAQALQVHFREIHTKRNSIISSTDSSGIIFKCGHCSLAFKTESKFQFHCMYHMLTAVVQCSICQAFCPSVKALREHLNFAHSELSSTDSENLQKTIDLNIYLLCSSSGCEKFLPTLFGSPMMKKIANSQDSGPSRCPSRSLIASTEQNGLDKADPGNDAVDEEEKEKSFSVGDAVDNMTTDTHAAPDSVRMLMKEIAERIEREDDEAEQLEMLKKSFPDQQSLEDFINSQAMAEGNYEDPLRKFKCHRCKVGFTKQSYLTTHNKTQQHRRGDKVNSSVERYLDPNRPHKCEICKESFTQKNILLVHYNSVSHLHKLKMAHQQGTLPAAVISTTNHPSPSNSPTLATTTAGDSERKPYRCNICKVAYAQATNLEIHIRSVGHQSCVSKIRELVMAGQINIHQPLIEQPDMMIDLQSQQLQQMLAEVLQQQAQPFAAVTSSSLLLQALPSLTLSMMQGLPQFVPQVSSSMLSSATSFANAVVLDSEMTNNQLEPHGKLVFKSHENGLSEQTKEDQGFDRSDMIRQMKLEPESFSDKLEIVIKKEVEGTDEKAAGIFSENPNAQLSTQKIEMATNTIDGGLSVQNSRVSDSAFSPTLAASLPVALARPRGFMGRFKPQIHRNLLENIGFECVMQFNEYSQLKRKDKDAEKDGIKQEQEEKLQDSVEKKIANDVAKDVNIDSRSEEEKKNKVDLPEINKSLCLKCGKEFSSVFVLKAHEEEVHKSVVPIDVVEDFGEKFKFDFEKKLPKQELELTSSASQLSVSQTVTVSTAEKLPPKVSTSEMPPPPPPPPQMSTAFDIAQMMPMLSMMPMPMPMNLMSLGMQPPLMPMLQGSSMDISAGFLPHLGIMDSNLLSAQQTMQQAAAAAAQNQKRVRTRISDDQLKILRAHFDINNSPSEAQINQMSEQSGLPQKVIKHWFRNTLFKERQRNKDSPYNFNNPPSTSIDLEEYEKTGKIPAVKVEPRDDEDDDPLLPVRKEEPDFELEHEIPVQLPLRMEMTPKVEPADDRKEYESCSNASSPSNVSSIPSTPSCSAPATPTPTSTPSNFDAHAAAIARETAAQAAMSKRANRTRFTDYQVKMLQEYFEQNAYPKDDELDHLSKLLGLSPRVIVVWFQNARQKARKIYENQPAADTKEGNTPFQRTPSLNYQCKKCNAVFQRYYELIKHQKRPCLSENNNNKPMTALTDDDSLSSCTSLDDSVLSDSMSNSMNSMPSMKENPISNIASAFRCDKCSATFNRIDLWQEHQKVHSMNPALFPPFSNSSAFGMLQSLAQQEDSKAMTSASLVAVKRKLDIEDDRSDDQPRDKRLRTTILPEQLDYLYQKYQVDCNPSRKQLETIAQEVGLKKRVVQVWFQNTRARERKGQYRAHQQLIHKRCPFCRALFRAKSALESHLATKHPEEMAKGEINVDTIPDAALESPQPAHSLPSSCTPHHSIGADLNKILSPNSMQPYLSFMPPVSLPLGFPPAMASDPLQLSMKQIYEDSYKKYISELSGNAHPTKVSHILEPLTPSPARHIENEKRVPQTSAGDDEAPLDLSIPVKPSSSNSSSSSSKPQASTSFSSLEKSSRDYERSRRSSLDDSYSETHSEMADMEYQNELGSSPPSPRTNSSSMQNKRYRTQMTSLQVRVMKTLFVDYKTPTMSECELLGREISLPKRVVQVWFQNARAKEKKSKLAMTKSYCSENDFPKTPEECSLCNFKYSHKFTVQDHIFTKRHIDNVKTYIQSQADMERDISDPVGVSGILRQQSREVEQRSRKLWDETSPSTSHLSQLQAMGLNNATAFGLPTTHPGVSVSASLGLGATPPLGAESSKKSHHHRDESTDKDKKKSSSSAEQQQQQQQAAELALSAQMMALGSYLPSLDPAYFSLMYSGLPGYFPGMAAMPLLQPGLLPGAEHLMAYDPLSFGTPLPLLQIPASAIKNVSEKLGDASCTLAQYTQDCKTRNDLKGMVSSADFSCAWESSVDVGYICKKCQMVYPAREACLTHQHTTCFVSGGEGGKNMLKLEQVQYECRACGDKFSTLYEYKLHCQLDIHKSKVHKLGLKASTSTASSSAKSTSSATSHSSSSSSTSTKYSSSPTTFPILSAAHSSSRSDFTATTLPSFNVSQKRAHSSTTLTSVNAASSK